MPDFGIFRGFGSNLFSDKLYAGQLPTQLGLIGSINVSLLLDLYPNAAAAYSLRKLREAYTGSAIKVRNSSNSELDIGFVNNVLDTASLLTHCGSGNGFVTTWYDQSGNGRNATQTTAASQPQIVSSGSVLTKYSKPNILFTSQSLNIGTQLLLNDQISLFGVFNSSSVGNTAGFINYLSSPSDDPELRIGNEDRIFDYYNGGYAFAVGSDSASFITGGLYAYTRLTGYTSRVYRNGSLLLTSNTRAGALASGVSELTIGRYNFANNNRNGNISELIIYNSDKTSDIDNLETNINDYYAIY